MAPTPADTIAGTPAPVVSKGATAPADNTDRSTGEDHVRALSPVDLTSRATLARTPARITFDRSPGA
ncbi:hypothetical protein ITP53_30450 [Nonomuraea sp. K274]|uniref:FXSXX-COOH protein n=1 Tax=Nonomuraea cypriaca TaxID=1187855 RepID=A0A931ABV4_9ACTN|nr:hypothetical protein [Nonomuraea cypriaca]MBF8189971.1 hypothetical protein [Nonomuraea cypriaca]